MNRPAVPLLLAAALGGCATVPLRPIDTTLWTADGQQVGAVSLREDRAGLSVRVEARGLSPGPHGLHFHGLGRCDAPDFASAGPHWNPHGRQHGAQNPQGAHAGDLPNLVAGPDGRGTLAVHLPGVRLRGGAAALLDADGAALLVHASADDGRTDPSGNSGARIACAVLTG